MPTIEIAEQELYYVEQGAGETLLIFPDNLHAAGAYEKELAHFSDRFHVLAFDYPGAGKSTRDVKYADEREYDLWNFHADFACHLLMELGIESCYAMGFGEGALVALHFVGKQTGLHDLAVKGVIADSFLSRLDSRTLHRQLDRREHYYVRNHRWLKELHGDDWREVLDADTATLRRLADRGGYEIADFVFNGIGCPVLLTGNQKDPLTPGIAHEFARLSALIPDCTTYLAAESGHRYDRQHPLMWSNPDRFRALADLFLG